MNRCIVKPEEQMHCQRSLSALSYLVGHAQAARPLAGSSSLAVLGRSQNLQNVLALAAIRQTGRMNQSRELCEPLVRSMPHQIQHWEVERESRVRPNPSIEPTSTGWARYARCSLSASRAQPVPAAHVKR
jgi:hypothetical protein